MSSWCVGALWCGLWLSMAGPAFSAEWDASELEKTVRGSADAYIKAFQEGNAERIAALFTAEAEVVEGDGVVFHGRDAIQAEYEAFFAAQKPGELTIELTSIRPIAAGVLIEEGISRRQPAADGPVTLTRYVATHVRQSDGKWLIASVRELDSPTMTAHERLKDLEWLVGTWRDENPDGVVESQWKWSPDGSYLIAEFRMRRHREKGDGTLSGTHRVGWDPQRKQFRSWVFDAEGGFASGWWSESNGVWSVPLTVVTAEGGSASATLMYQRLSKDVMVVMQRDRVIDGEHLPDVEVRVARKPPGIRSRRVPSA